MTSTDEAQAYQSIKAKLSNRYWRLNNLYYIKDKSGQKVLMRFNEMQESLYSNLWYFNAILKARQLGCTTFALVYFLDACLFNSNHAAGIIAHTRHDAEDLFKNKVKFAYDNLPEWLKAEIKATSSSARSLDFSNSSSIVVGTSLRSGTFQKLLVSEYGKISAKYPEKAREIKTGALNTVEVGQQIFVESTAEGKNGEFYELCERARKLQLTAQPLSKADPRFHFFPWHKNSLYRLTTEEAEHVVITEDLAKYLAQFNVSKEQAAWYATKYAVLGDDMRREYPSTPEEAFEGSLQGAYYLNEMSFLRSKGRINAARYNPSHSVFTAWDLGLNDQMAIWFFQIIQGEPYLIDYHESIDEGWQYYADMLKSKGYVYEKHIFPHDGNKRVRGGVVITDKQAAENLGIRPIVIVPRTTSVMIDIRNYCKPTLLQCRFNEETCSVGIDRLDCYRKKWNRTTSQFEDSPLHDEASHGADAFRTLAVAFKTGLLKEHVPNIKNTSAGLTTRRHMENPTRRLRR